MSDDGMDLCGVIWNHEISMRRLLSLLRQSQSTCSDTECYAPIQTNSGQDGFMTLTLCWMAMVFFLFLMRPTSIRNRDNDLKPPRGDDGSNGGGGNPPAPPNAI